MVFFIEMSHGYLEQLKSFVRLCVHGHEYQQTWTESERKTDRESPQLLSQSAQPKSTCTSQSKREREKKELSKCVIENFEVKCSVKEEKIMIKLF